MKRLLASCILALVIPFSVAAAIVDDITARAESGDADAQFTLADMYKKGDGVAQSDTAAAQWYGKAADLGHLNAKLAVARAYLSGRGVEMDKCRGLYFAQNAAELGDVDAQYLTGLLYKHGHCGGSNPTKAQQWLVLADANGDRDAASSLAMEYFMGGYGFEKDYQKSVYWFRKAMTHETAKSKVNVAAPDYRKVIASAAADDWWQHNSGLVLAD